MDNPNGAKPGQPKVPLHVGVEGEELPGLIHAHVVSVAEAADQLVPVVEFWVDPHDGAARGHNVIGVSPWIDIAIQKKVFLEIAAGREGIFFDDGVGMVAILDVDKAIGTAQDGVGAVLAHAAVGSHNEIDLVGRVVPVFIHKPVEARTLGAIALNQQIAGPHKVERHDALYLFGETFLRIVDPIAIFIDEDADAVLLGPHDRAAQVVEGHIDDGANERVAGDFFNVKAVGQAETLALERELLFSRFKIGH